VPHVCYGVYGVEDAREIQLHRIPKRNTYSPNVVKKIRLHFVLDVTNYILNIT